MKALRGEVTGRGVQSLPSGSPHYHPRPTEVLPRLSFTPEEAALVTGFSRTRIFRAIRDDELTARKSGKATVIETTELTRWIRSLPTRGRQPQSAA
jgi:excisionase family DNA binding protein